jgi:hypothetical protein
MAMQAAGRAMNRRVLNLIKSIATSEYKKDGDKVSETGPKPKKSSSKSTTKKSKPSEVVNKQASAKKSAKKASVSVNKSKETNEK